MQSTTIKQKFDNALLFRIQLCYYFVYVVFALSLVKVRNITMFIARLNGLRVKWKSNNRFGAMQNRYT